MFRSGVKRNHYEKLIGIRKFLEWLALDCFSNNFSTDIGTPENNTHHLDEANEGQKFSTCRVLHVFSCISPSTAAITISDITLNSALSISYLAHGSFQIWVNTNDILMRHLLLTKIFNQKLIHLFVEIIFISISNLLFGKYVRTQSRVLEEIKSVTKCNEKTP